MSPSLTLVPLRKHPEVIEFMCGQLVREWPAWYGPGGPGDAIADLSEFANQEGKLPVGVVAFADDGSCLGIAALKASSIPGFEHLSPWAGAGLVVPGWRRKGIGAALLDGLLAEAQRLGFPRVYCATATAASLLERQGWRLLERTDHDGRPISIYAIEVMQQGPSGAA